MTCSERSLKTGGSGDGTGSGVGRGSTCSDESGSLRETGIEIVGEVPWGTHFCQFYQTKQDLIDTLIPYITAGLESNEFCMWITSEPLGVDEAAQALRESVPDLDRRFAEGQIEIIPHTAWYLRDGVFDQQRVLDGWVLKLNAALAKGYVGLRLTGNTFWLEKDDWQDFTDYEEAINLVIGNYRMLAACTYSLEKCGASEIADVVSNHEFAMMKRRGKWTVIESSTVKQAGKALQAALDELETRTSELEKLNLDLAAANGTLEVANEELAVTNEEIEAANEELRVSEDELRCEIEERIRVERELQRLNRTLLAHSKSDQAMMRSTDESDYLQEVCRSSWKIVDTPWYG
jgi:hypothetical protein